MCLLNVYHIFLSFISCYICSGLLQSARWHPPAGVIQPTYMDTCVSWTVPSGHVMMTSYLHIQLTQQADAYMVIQVFTDAVLMKNLVWEVTGLPDDEPFIVEAAKVVIVISQDGHLVYPDLPGFRMVFTFHQVDVMAVEDVAMEATEVAAVAAEERALEVEALEVVATVMAMLASVVVVAKVEGGLAETETVFELCRDRNSVGVVQRQKHCWSCAETETLLELCRERNIVGVVQRQKKCWSCAEKETVLELYREKKKKKNSVGVVQRKKQCWSCAETETVLGLYRERNSVGVVQRQKQCLELRLWFEKVTATRCSRERNIVRIVLVVRVSDSCAVCWRLELVTAVQCAGG